ncbi:MAG: hypothetical protein AVDCRST_MAG53-2373, partial [uncultured Solirubrobacteraceae bacterium]
DGQPAGLAPGLGRRTAPGQRRRARRRRRCRCSPRGRGLRDRDRGSRWRDGGCEPGREVASGHHGRGASGNGRRRGQRLGRPRAADRARRAAQRPGGADGSRAGRGGWRTRDAHRDRLRARGRPAGDRCRDMGGARRDAGWQPAGCGGVGRASSVAV